MGALGVGWWRWGSRNNFWSFEFLKTNLIIICPGVCSFVFAFSISLAFISVEFEMSPMFEFVLDLRGEPDTI